jgi:alkanesulfonate monooxygenase SsuD/methylene tetrahydromethanopterin reductase-like flavin-dependent oxidoreductase (luciferase family)
MVSIQDCGLMFEPQMGLTMKELVVAAEQAEQLGFGYLFRSDHLLPTDEFEDKMNVDAPECWTSLGVIASATSGLKFGPMVTPVGFRNPALLAKMACTLDSFSEGRLQLGIGAGWFRKEYRAYGYEFPSFGIRRNQFEEALRIILPLIREGKVDFNGSYFSAHTECHPRPAGKIPVIIGARANSIVRIAAQEADEWNMFSAGPDTFLARKAMFENYSQGRHVQVSETGPFMIGRTTMELESNAKRQLLKFSQSDSVGDFLKRLKSRGLACGTVDEFVECLASKVESGIQRFYFQTLVPENVQMTELLADTLKHNL